MAMKINTIRLRVVLGVLAILLPWIVAVLAKTIPSSISATYYISECTTPFMIILGACSILLICYKGYDLQDDIILTLSGIMGLGICFFPTWVSGLEFVGTFHTPVLISTNLHNICAVIFFGLLSYNSIFLFTKGDGNPTRNKKIRNIIYIVSGVGMLASFLLMLLPSFRIQIWLVETIALSFFGLSFLTKADVFPFLFCDSPYQD
jgi:hypothetical protein